MIKIYNEQILSNNIPTQQATIAQTVTGQDAIKTIPPFYALPEQTYNAKVVLPQLPDGTYTAKLKLLMDTGDYAPVALREFRVG